MWYEIWRMNCRDFKKKEEKKLWRYFREVFYQHYQTAVVFYFNYYLLGQYEALCAVIVEQVYFFVLPSKTTWNEELAE